MNLTSFLTAPFSTFLILAHLKESLNGFYTNAWKTGRVSLDYFKASEFGAGVKVIDIPARIVWFKDKLLPKAVLAVMD